MKRTFFDRRLGRALGLALAAASWGLVPLACGDDASDLAGGLDGSPGGGGSDAASSDDSASDAAPQGAWMRLAHLSPDVGPVDFCYRTSPSEAFIGPLILGVPSADAGGLDAGQTPASDAGDAQPGDAQSSDAGDAGAPLPPPGVSFPDATKYFSVPASATLEIAVVRAVDGNCATPRVRLRTMLNPGKHFTVALMGLSQADAGTQSALTVVAFADDPSPSAGTTRTRFVHAALGFGKYSGPSTLTVEAIDHNNAIPLSAAIEPGHASTPRTTPPIVDTLGYHDGPPLASGALHVAEVGSGTSDASAASWLSAVSPLDFREGATHTGFIVSDGKAKLGVLLCDDGASGASCVALHP